MITNIIYNNHFIYIQIKLTIFIYIMYANNFICVYIKNYMYICVYTDIMSALPGGRPKKAPNRL